MVVLQLIAATHVQQCLLQKNARKIVKVSYNCWSYGDNETGFVLAPPLLW